jgi:hypothetical protein
LTDVDVDDGRSRVRRDNDTIKTIKDGAGSADIFLKSLKYGWGVTEDVDTLRSANGEKSG